MVGYSEDELVGSPMCQLIHPEDRDSSRTKVRELLAQKIRSFEISNRYLTRNGASAWARRSVSLLRDANGASKAMIVLAADISETVRQKEKIDLLMREVNHRSKNVLSFVQAIAQQTAAKSPGDFVTRFRQRLHALAANQDLLVKNEWKGVPIDELVRTQFAPFEDMIGSRIMFSGRPVWVSARAAQTLGMALYELATNAAKYGALGAVRGSITIEWWLHSEGEGQTFHMSWRERGAVDVSPPAKTGFGSVVIRQMVESSLDAKVELDYSPGGITWLMGCPAKEVLQFEAGK